MIYCLFLHLSPPCCSNTLPSIKMYIFPLFSFHLSPFLRISTYFLLVVVHFHFSFIKVSLFLPTIIYSLFTLSFLTNSLSFHMSKLFWSSFYNFFKKLHDNLQMHSHPAIPVPNFINKIIPIINFKVMKNV